MGKGGVVKVLTGAHMNVTGFQAIASPRWPATATINEHSSVILNSGEGRSAASVPPGRNVSRQRPHLQRSHHLFVQSGIQ